MPDGFFQIADLTPPGPRVAELPRCGECGLYLTCKSPKMPVYGDGAKKILICGEAPGETEDERGQPFCGKAGTLLREKLERFDVRLRRDCWTVNSIACRPDDNKLPPKSVDHCRPLVVRAIRRLKPEVIILLGTAAVHSVIGWLWKQDTGGVNRWAGFQIPSRRLNAWICPTWHPSHVMREEPGKQLQRELLERVWEKHLGRALRLKGRPRPRGEKPLNAGFEITMDHRFAASCLRSMLSVGKPIAYDYETDRLKPDHADARIISCAVSDGGMTVAYPWHGEAVKATGELLFSKIPKWGLNLKFEDRWTRKIFGRGVRNWQWDGMLAAHVLDNRSGITSLKYQAFCTLGEEPYSEAIEPYLKGEPDGGNNPNRITQYPLEKVLLYNAYDAILEYRLAAVQRKKLGVD